MAYDRQLLDLSPARVASYDVQMEAVNRKLNYLYNANDPVLAGLATNYSSEVMTLASTSNDYYQFADQMLELAGQSHVDQSVAHLSALSNTDAAALWATFTPKRKAMLGASGYQVPTVTGSGDSGGLLNQIGGAISGGVEFVGESFTSAPSKLLEGGLSIMDKMFWVADKGPNHLVRMIEALDESADGQIGDWWDPNDIVQVAMNPGLIKQAWDDTWDGDTWIGGNHRKRIEEIVHDNRMDTSIIHPQEFATKIHQGLGTEDVLVELGYVPNAPGFSEAWVQLEQMQKTEAFEEVLHEADVGRSSIGRWVSQEIFGVEDTSQGVGKLVSGSGDLIFAVMTDPLGAGFRAVKAARFAMYSVGAGTGDDLASAMAQRLDAWQTWNKAGKQGTQAFYDRAQVTSTSLMDMGLLEGAYRSHPLSADRWVDRLFNIESVGRIAAGRQAKAMDRYLTKMAGYVKRAVDGDASYMSEMLRDSQAREMVPVFDDIVTKHQVNVQAGKSGFDTAEGFASYLGNRSAMNNVLANTNMMGWRTGQQLMPMTFKSRGMWESSRTALRKGQGDITINGKPVDNPNAVYDVSGKDKDRGVMAWMDDQDQWADMTVEEKVRTDPWRYVPEFAYDPKTGKRGSPKNFGGWGRLGNISTRLQRSMRKAATLSPKENFITLGNPDAVGMFSDYLEYGRALGLHDQNTADELLHAFALGNEATKSKLILNYQANLVVSGGIGELTTEVGGRATTFSDHYVKRLHQVYGSRGQNEALWSQQLTEQMPIMDFTEFYRAYNTAAAGYIRSGVNKMHYGILDPFMTKYWSRLQILRPGFIPRNGGEEMVSAWLNSAKGPITMFKSHLLMNWLMDERHIRRTTGIHPSVVPANTDRVNNLVVLMPDGRTENIEVTMEMLRKANLNKQGLYEFDVPGGGTVLKHPVELGLEVSQYGRELMALRIPLFFSHWIRNVSGLTAPQQMFEIQQMLTKDPSLFTSKLGMPNKTFTSYAEMEKWAKESPAKRQAFTAAIQEAGQEWWEGQSKLARSLMHVDQMGQVFARRWGQNWNRLINQSGATPVRQRIAKALLSDTEQNDFKTAWRMMTAVPGVADIQNEIMGGVAFSPYVGARVRQADALANDTINVRSSQGGKVRKSMRMKSIGAEFSEVNPNQIEYTPALVAKLMAIEGDAGGRRGARAMAHAPIWDDDPGYRTGGMYQDIETLLKDRPSTTPTSVAEEVVGDVATETKRAATELGWNTESHRTFGNQLRARMQEILAVARYDGQGNYGLNMNVEPALSNALGDPDAMRAAQVDNNILTVAARTVEEPDADLGDLLEQTFNTLIIELKDYFGDQAFGGDIGRGIEDWWGALGKIQQRFGGDIQTQWADMKFLFDNMAEAGDTFSGMTRPLMDPTHHYLSPQLESSALDQLRESGTRQEFNNQFVYVNIARGELSFPNNMDSSHRHRRVRELMPGGIANLPPENATSGYAPMLPPGEYRARMLEIFESPEGREAFDTWAYETLKQNGTEFYVGGDITPSEAGRYLIETIAGQNYDPFPNHLIELAQSGTIGPEDATTLKAFWKRVVAEDRAGMDQPFVSAYNEMIVPMIGPRKEWGAKLRQRLMDDFETFRAGEDDIRTEVSAKWLTDQQTGHVPAFPFSFHNADDARTMHASLTELLAMFGTPVRDNAGYSTLGRVDFDPSAYAQTGPISRSRLARGEKGIDSFNDRDVLRTQAARRLQIWEDAGGDAVGGRQIPDYKLRQLDKVSDDSNLVGWFTDADGNTQHMDAVIGEDGVIAPNPEAFMYEPNISDNIDELVPTGQVVHTNGVTDQMAAKVFGVEKGEELRATLATDYNTVESNEVLHQLIWGMENGTITPDWLDYNLDNRFRPKGIMAPPTLVAEEVSSRGWFTKMTDFGFTEFIGPVMDAFVRTPHYNLQFVKAVGDARVAYNRFVDTEGMQAATRMLSDTSGWFKENSDLIVPRIDQLVSEQLPRYGEDPILDFFLGLRQGKLDFGALEQIPDANSGRLMSEVRGALHDNMRGRSQDWRLRRSKEAIAHEADKMLDMETGVIPKGSVDVDLTAAQKRDVTRTIRAIAGEKARPLWNAAANEGMAFEAQATLAAKIALRKTVPFVDDHRIRSQMARQLSAFLPFWFAEEQFIKRSARLLMEAPEAIHRASRAMHGLEAMGYVEEDQYGNTMLTIPGIAETFNLWNEFSAKLFGKELTLPIADVGRFDMQYMLPGFNTKAGVPQWGPAVSMPLSVMADKFPELRQIEAIVANEETGVAPQSAWEYILPGWAKNIYEGATNNPVEMGSAYLQAAGALQMNDGTKITEESTPLEIATFQDRATNWTRITIINRAIFGFFAGSKPQIENMEQVELRSEFQDLLKTGLNWEEAQRIFMEVNPDATMATIYGTKSATGAPVQSTWGAGDWVANNDEFLTSFPSAGTWAIPFDPQGNLNDEFSRRTHEEFLSRELRVRKSPDEVVKDLLYRQTANVYFPEMEQATREIAYWREMGRPDTAAQVEEEWRSRANLIRATSPVFEERYTSGAAKNRREQQISEFRTMLRLPTAAQPQTNSWQEIRPMVQMLVQAQDDLDAMTYIEGAAATARRDQIKQQAYSAAERYARIHPRAMVFFNSVVRYALGGLDTELELHGTGVALNG